MEAIKLTTNIGADGKIILPDSLQHLFLHEVEIILLYKPIDSTTKVGSPKSSNVFEALDRITKIYAQSNEPDLDVKNIYKRRTESHDRQIRFD